ncbi:hypothetical protein PV04_10144 [Phialophora macrospora]|uniref:Uncharacterized protein n=1 Tax=Phialophora macrospora TaxID=1851006 RepID=A0A0D2F8M2_9EURO|nr:hypothetical protein PV04_10144 [Phialophora macrospora]
MSYPGGGGSGWQPPHPGSSGWPYGAAPPPGWSQAQHPQYPAGYGQQVPAPSYTSGHQQNPYGTAYASGSSQIPYGTAYASGHQQIPYGTAYASGSSLHPSGYAPQPSVPPSYASPAASSAYPYTQAGGPYGQPQNPYQQAAPAAPHPASVQLPSSHASQRADCVFLSISILRETTIPRLQAELNQLPNKLSATRRNFREGVDLGDVEVIIECWTREHLIYPSTRPANGEHNLAFLSQVPRGISFGYVYDLPAGGLHTVVGTRNSQGHYSFWDYQRDRNVIDEVDGCNPRLAFWWDQPSQLIEDDSPEF